jgi:hypothetical protein
MLISAQVKNFAGPLRVSGLLALLLLASCDLFSVTDSENTRGRGAQAFDPYRSSKSGAIRLSLQMLNGCAILPTGQSVKKGSQQIPYPSMCPEFHALEPTNVLTPPKGTLQLLNNTTYFLNQLTFTEMVVNAHRDPENLGEAVQWMKTQTRFRSLDWNNLGKVAEDWHFYDGFSGVTPDAWVREVLFDNANWRKVEDDTFTVEILDPDNVPRSTPVAYKRSEFLTDSPHAGHSRIAWRLENVQPPRFPGDNQVRPLVTEPGYSPTPPLFRTMVRLDMVGSLNPFKTFSVGALRGEHTLKITWSQMPEEPFYFPVTFISREDLPATCANEAGEPRPCGFGIEPRIDFSKPANGRYYEPGETLHLFMDVRDGEGHRLHAPELLPSGAGFWEGEGNGLLYSVLPYFTALQEKDSFPGYMLAGPLQKLTPRSDPNLPTPYYKASDITLGFVNELAPAPIFPTLYSAPWSTRYQHTLPEDAEAGTYVALVKTHRYFLGERVARTNAFFFQVGTEEKTSYPERVGNCQICHRGVLSLDNLRHGLAVDHVEACKGCHHRHSDVITRMQVQLHRLHMRSPRFTASKQDCTLCHITRESALRPSIDACSSCHPSIHGDTYFQERFNLTGTPSRFGNCAQACHVNPPPKGHFLPEN